MKKFPTLAVVSAATGWKVTEDLEEVRVVLSYMMNRKLRMDEMTLAFNLAQPALESLYPWMGALEFLYDDKKNKRKCSIILKKYGEELEVPMLTNTIVSSALVRR